MTPRSLAVARALGVSDGVSRHAFQSFMGVPGRLELIGEKDGVKVYNDDDSTTPEATLAALAALGTENTIVIAGGTDKNLELDTLVAKLKETKHVVLLAGTGTDRIKTSFQILPYMEVFLKQLPMRLHMQNPGDTVLFSPSFTSFGMFKNEFDRGDQFVETVKNLS